MTMKCRGLFALILKRLPFLRVAMFFVCEQFGVIVKLRGFIVTIFFYYVELIFVYEFFLDVGSNSGMGIGPLIFEVDFDVFLEVWTGLLLACWIIFLEFRKNQS